ncbi:MAG TPA: toll/interleukin-1 receptor domain-containing protein [Allosphingosinicella sp.]|nr:toll/interleukin-1 receptor domain-containing protein [Allosphingosinicella sp.]
MVDVFISYSRANRDMVRRIAEAIGALGYVVWWDEELPAHLTYGDVITEKIGEAKATLVVWSVESAASEWVRAEADLARNQKKLIQTAIDDCAPPLPFNQIQYAAIGDWTGEADHAGWRKAKASLVALCGPAPAAAESPAAAPVAAAPIVLPVPTPAPAAAPAVTSVAAGWAVPKRQRRANRTTRLAFGAIAASLLTILTVGGLVLLKGPPTAHAEAGAPAPAAAAVPAPVPAPTPARTTLPPKAVVVDVPVQAQAEETEGDALSEVDNLPDVRDDF